MEFGADYPFEKVAPVKLKSADLKGRKGAFGKPLIGHSFEDLIKDLPIYAQNGLKGNGTEFPEWKKKYIRQNRNFYETHKSWLKKWIPKVMEFENSHQKFEWNCGKVELIIKDKIVQFRPSGIRVKMPTFSPALVLTTTQIPIFPWLDRYMTRKEAAKLQCMDGLKELPNSTSKAFNALGNAVNVQVVKSIANNLLK
jgi:DNA (cytosine-5)-methyltransferase 1